MKMPSKPLGSSRMRYASTQMKTRRSAPRKFRKTLKGQWCVYCGEVAQCLDHFPPLSVQLGGLLLPSCNECNLLAGVNWPYDFQRRAKYVLERLRLKYRREMETPDWCGAELKQLRGGLKGMVKKWQERKDYVARRLRWNALAYLACIDHDDVVARMQDEMAASPKLAREAFVEFKFLEDTSV